MDELMAKRLDKQPLDGPSAGSAFKRPVGALPLPPLTSGLRLLTRRCRCQREALRLCGEPGRRHLRMHGAKAKKYAPS